MEDLLEKADELKDLGNQFFKAKNYYKVNMIILGY